MQLPAAKAGAIFQVNKYKGKFHGEINPTIPMGDDSVLETAMPSKWEEISHLFMMSEAK